MLGISDKKNSCQIIKKHMFLGNVCNHCQMFNLCLLYAQITNQMLYITYLAGDTLKIITLTISLENIDTSPVV